MNFTQCLIIQVLFMEDIILHTARILLMEIGIASMIPQLIDLLKANLFAHQHMFCFTEEKDWSTSNLTKME